MRVAPLYTSLRRFAARRNDRREKAIALRPGSAEVSFVSSVSLDKNRFAFLFSKPENSERGARIPVGKCPPSNGRCCNRSSALAGHHVQTGIDSQLSRFDQSPGDGNLAEPCHPIPETVPILKNRLGGSDFSISGWAPERRPRRSRSASAQRPHRSGSTSGATLGKKFRLPFETARQRGWKGEKNPWSTYSTRNW